MRITRLFLVHSPPFHHRYWKISYRWLPAIQYRGRILGRNPDKILPCYSVTSTNGFYSLPSFPLSRSGFKLVCNVNIVYGILRTFKIMPQKPQGHCTFMSSASAVRGLEKNSLSYFVFFLTKCITNFMVYFRIRNFPAQSTSSLFWDTFFDGWKWFFVLSGLLILKVPFFRTTCVKNNLWQHKNIFAGNPAQNLLSILHQ